MTVPLEAVLRDFLAGHLDLIEPGLTLIETEYVLSSSAGAGGRIDILALDRYGLTVVIELKRSDKTAREAIQEIHKYVGLLKMERGLGDASIRCLIVSTHWHELLIPFSEFVLSAVYPVDGLRLVLDDGGTPTKAERVDPLPSLPEQQLCPIHYALTFATGEARDAAVLQIAEKLSVLDAFVIFAMDYTGESERVIYPFAAYLVAAHRGSCPIEREGEAEEDEYNEEEHDLISHSGAFEDLTSDEILPAHPEKFRTLVDWAKTSTTRGGTLVDERLYPLDQLVIDVAGLQGGNPKHFQKIGTPYFAKNWSSLVEAVAYPLRGNSIWSEGVSKFLDSVARQNPRATVGVYVFNPQDLFQSLYAYVSTEEPTFFPGLEIVSDESSNGQVRVLQGFLAWDGSVVPTDPELVIATVLEGDAFAWALHGTMGSLGLYDDAMVHASGLQYVLVEHTLRLEGSSEVRWVIGNDTFKSLGEWISANECYVYKVVELVNRIMPGRSIVITPH